MREAYNALGGRRGLCYAGSAEGWLLYSCARRFMRPPARVLRWCRRACVRRLVAEAKGPGFGNALCRCIRSRRRPLRGCRRNDGCGARRGARSAAGFIHEDGDSWRTSGNFEGRRGGCLGNAAMIGARLSSTRKTVRRYRTARRRRVNLGHHANRIFFAETVAVRPVGGAGRVRCECGVMPSDAQESFRWCLWY